MTNFYEQALAEYRVAHPMRQRASDMTEEMRKQVLRRAEHMRVLAELARPIGRDGELVPQK